MGDRVKADDHPHLGDEFRNQVGTIIEIGHGTTSHRWVKVDLDEVAPPAMSDGWDFAPERLSLVVEGEPSEEEIAALFGLATTPLRDKVLALARDLVATLEDPTQAWDIAVADFEDAVDLAAKEAR